MQASTIARTSVASGNFKPNEDYEKMQPLYILGYYFMKCYYLNKTIISVI